VIANLKGAQLRIDRALRCLDLGLTAKSESRKAQDDDEDR
jgi:hypothetical protein